jgi:N-acetylglucosamine-6-sulfatase
VFGGLSLAISFVSVPHRSAQHRSRLGAAALAAVLLALIFATTPVDASAQPNVVVLMTDDQTAESMRVMPRTRELIGAEGVTFTNSFVSYPRCCPSRATFFTGQYAHNHGVLSNTLPFGSYDRLDTSSWLPSWLQSAGYRTAHLGKFLNGYGDANPTEVPPGWDEWHATTGRETYRYWGYTLNENGALESYGRDGDPDLYATDFQSRRATELVEDLAGSVAPFFLSVGFLAPHTGGPSEPGDPPGFATPAVAPRHRGAFAAEPLPRPPGFGEPNVSDKPPRIKRMPRLRWPRIAVIRQKYRQRLESLLAVDEGVERIIGALRESGELENTLVIFTSDNGFFHGEHRIWSGKAQVYEPGIRVPLLMRGPGITPGRRASRIVGNVDLASTIAEATGAFPWHPLDGRSLLPLARAPVPRWRDQLLLEGGDRLGLDYDGIRTPRYAYAEHRGGARELYDLRLDPYQLRSVHNSPAYAAVRAALELRLANLRICAGSNCRAAPAPLPRPLLGARG